MTNHFYVEHAAMMGSGLSSLGTQRTNYFPSNLQSIEGLAGAIIGEGIFNTSEANKQLELTIHGISHPNPFVRRCSAFSLGLSYLGQSDTNSLDLNLFKKLLRDENVDVRRTAIISLGLAYLRKGDNALTALVNDALEDPAWKIRAAAGIAHSFAFLGNPENFDRFVQLLKAEESPYVKVCSCWYVSLAHAGREETQTYIELIAEGDSFFRDMASLGLGFSHLGMSNKNVRDMLTRLAKSDEHPYVRESSYFGLGLNDFQNPNNEFDNAADIGLKDPSPIARSGAGLSLGLAHYKDKNLDLERRLSEETDPSVQWGMVLSNGLSQRNATVSDVVLVNPYIAWAYELSKGFCNGTPITKQTNFADINAFQQNVNDGMRASTIPNDKKDAFRLLYPGIFYYTVYESFWWGLWVLSSLGIATWNGPSKT